MTTIRAAADARAIASGVCDCRRRTEVVGSRIPVYLDGHLMPICRLSAVETEWYCVDTLIHWVRTDVPGTEEVLRRIDPTYLVP